MRFFARSLVLALIAGLLAAAPASAQTTVTIRGGGWGHGIGMSQYGAYGRALNGQSSTQILEHYYSGAKVTRVSTAPVRVGLLQGRGQISVTSSAYRDGGGRVVFKSSGKKIAEGRSGITWRLEPANTGGVRIYKGGNQVVRDGRRVFGSPSKPVLLKYEKQGSLVRVTEKAQSYAYGKLEFGTYQTGTCGGDFCLRLVAKLSMQKYLYGLGEVPSSWPGAALRSQAIAGRTYAYEKAQRLGNHRDPCDCTVYDSTIDQAYIGDGKRTGSGQWWDDWKAAVDNTDREVILHSGAPIQALYSSSSGGHTEHNENVWGGTPLPYLRGVGDKTDGHPDNGNPNHKWTVKMGYAEFSNKLENYYNGDPDTRFGRFKSIDLVQPFGVSGRVTVVKTGSNSGGVRITGSAGNARVSGWSMRSALALKDTLFRIQIDYDTGERFRARYRRIGDQTGPPASETYAVPKGRKRPLGRAQEFRKGRMTWRKATGKVVWQWGKVLRKYDSFGREKSGLGMPASDIWGPGRYLGGSYVNGMLVWSKPYGTHAVKGSFRKAYSSVNGPKGPLGSPRGSKQKSRQLPERGLRQRFASGTLYFHRKAGKAFALWGGIDARYREMGQANSPCSYPTSNMTRTTTSAEATFQHGQISWTKPTGITVDCP